MADRLAKGAHVFIQGELNTGEYDRTTKVPNGKDVIEHVVSQLAVELKAETIRILDRSKDNDKTSEVAESSSSEQAPE